jgi:hypothetical protein
VEEGRGGGEPALGFFTDTRAHVYHVHLINRELNNLLYVILQQ